jgi:hypothetical protein
MSIGGTSAAHSPSLTLPCCPHLHPNSNSRPLRIIMSHQYSRPQTARKAAHDRLEFIGPAVSLQHRRPQTARKIAQDRREYIGPASQRVVQSEPSLAGKCTGPCLCLLTDGRRRIPLAHHGHRLLLSSLQRQPPRHIAVRSSRAAHRRTPSPATLQSSKRTSVTTLRGWVPLPSIISISSHIALPAFVLVPHGTHFCSHPQGHSRIGRTCATFLCPSPAMFALLLHPSALFLRWTHFCCSAHVCVWPLPVCVPAAQPLQLLSPLLLRPPLLLRIPVVALASF